MTEEQRDKIARDIGEGFTSGNFGDDEGGRCAWELKAEIWNEMQCAHYQCNEKRHGDTDSCAWHQSCDCEKVKGGHYKRDCK